MGCKSLSLILAVAMVLGCGALAQDLSVGGVRCCNVANVSSGHSKFDYGAAPPRWTAKEAATKTRIIVETVQPATSSNEIPGLGTTSKAPLFGGFLQYFANRADTIIANGIRPPFGGNIVLPLARGRVEIFGGFGGVYYQPTIFLRPGTAYVRRGVPYVQPNSWVTQAEFGGRAALDPEHHFWVGASSYHLINFADKTRRWSSNSADFTIRFGR